jgi:hypothetical protein
MDVMRFIKKEVSMAFDMAFGTKTKQRYAEKYNLKNKT